MAKMCDICGIRPATVRAQVTTSDGETKILELCEVDYQRLARQQRSSSPMESLFSGRGSLVDDFFGDRDGFFGQPPSLESSGQQDGRGGGRNIPVGSGRGRRSGGGAENLSENAMEMLQGAARRAA